jgi:hypothetical protein
VSSALVNIAIGLVTSVVGGAAVWLWQRVRNGSILRRQEAFFGLQPHGICLIVMNNTATKMGATHHNDVQTMIEVATLASGVGSAVLIESCNDFHEINGDRTEFCIGGPMGGSNPRTGAHLAAHLPGVRITPHDPARRNSLAIVVDGQEFRYDRGSEEHALVAKFTPPGSSRPVIVICGQSSIANRAAIHFLKREYRGLSKILSSTDQFCIIVRVTSSDAYGYQAAELAGDVSAVAFVSHRQPVAPLEMQPVAPPETRPKPVS